MRLTRAAILATTLLLACGAAGCARPDRAALGRAGLGGTMDAALTAVPTRTPTPRPTAEPTATARHPLAIESLRERPYAARGLTIEQTLDGGANYDRFVASYDSDGLKVLGLLTVPRGAVPDSGWPVVVFNHGYIPPAQYRTTERYVAYVDAFARNGYIVFKSDYRGHGDSEGRPEGAYGSPAYTVDVLNALAALRSYPGADPDRVGMWGHSMGGHITLRSMVVTDTIRAGVIWAGVVASYPDMLSSWRRPSAGAAAGTPGPSSSRRWGGLLSRLGSPDAAPEAWASISANSFVEDLSGPVQLHHGTADRSVPVAFSETLAAEIDEAGAVAELYLYPGDDHNISANFSTAMQRSVAFMDAHVKAAAARRE